MWSVWFFSQIFIAYFINLFVFSKCTYLTDFLSVYSYLNLNSKTLNSCRDKLGIIGLVVIPSFPRSWSWSRSHYQNSLLLGSWRLYQRLSTMRIFNPRPVLIHNMGKVACVAWRFCRAHYGAEKPQKCTQSARTSGEANLLEASLLSPILACFARPTKTAMLPQATGKISFLRPPISSPESSTSKHWIKMHWWQCKTENVSALWRINCLWHMHWIEILRGCVWSQTNWRMKEKRS